MPSFCLTPPSPMPTSLQENFELNHETLYLAVKLVDHYLVEVVSMRDKLQLIGSTAILIASKFEVTPRLPSWGAGAAGLCHSGAQGLLEKLPAVPGHCSESCWGSMSVLGLSLPTPRAADAVLVGWILSPGVAGDLALLCSAETP